MKKPQSKKEKKKNTRKDRGLTFGQPHSRPANTGQHRRDGLAVCRDGARGSETDGARSMDGDRGAWRPRGHGSGAASGLRSSRGAAGWYRSGCGGGKRSSASHQSKPDDARLAAVVRRSIHRMRG